MLDPTLLPITDGVRSLRLLAEDDAERYIAGTKDPLVQQFGHLPEPEYSSQDVRHLTNTATPSGNERGDLGLLSIIDESGIFLGSLVLFDCTSTSAEVGFWLHPDARGHGHAIGALELAAAFAKQSRLHEITARTVAGNDSSIHVLERAGFEEISREVERTPAGEVTPLILYRLDLISSTLNRLRFYLVLRSCPDGHELTVGDFSRYILYICHNRDNAAVENSPTRRGYPHYFRNTLIVSYLYVI